MSNVSNEFLSVILLDFYSRKQNFQSQVCYLVENHTINAIWKFILSKTELMVELSGFREKLHYKKFNP